jgi:hypothetical protein
MSATVILEGMLTGEAIREYLTTSKMGNPYGFYTVYRQFSKRVSYASVLKYFYILKELGLIRPVGFVPGKAPWRKHMYAIVKGKEADPAWPRPQIELYPSTKYGKKGYLRLKKKGLRPKGGRRTKYTWRGAGRGAAVPEALPAPVVEKPEKPKKKIEEKPPRIPKLLKPQPKPVVRPEKAKVIIVPKEQIEKRKAEGYKLIREIDGKFMMETPE